MFCTCSRICSITPFIRKPVPVSPMLADLLHNVFASRMNSCTRKSSCRPCGPPAASKSRAAVMWLASRSISSATSDRLASSASSCASRSAGASRAAPCHSDNKPRTVSARRALCSSICSAACGTASPCRISSCRSCSASTSASRAPSASRDPTSINNAASKPPRISASAASLGTNSASPAFRRSTPGSAMSDSIRGLGVPGRSAAQDSASATNCASSVRSTTTPAASGALSRNVTASVPRRSRAAISFRSSPSSRSNPAGSRKRTSNPRALTQRSSQAHPVAPPPESAANPVIEAIFAMPKPKYCRPARSGEGSFIAAPHRS